MSLNDQRRLKRHHLIYYLNVFDSSNEKEVGHLIDITFEGAKILSENSIPIGIQIRLRIMLPAGFPDIDYLEVEAESVRNSRDVNINFCNTGFRFINPGPDIKTTIEYLINEYGF
jgi:hypothetical protein